METLFRFIQRLSITALVLVVAGTAFAQEEQEKGTQPGIRWDVKKEYDEKGNIIRYDSSYSWSYSTPRLDQNLPDSLRDFFEFNFPEFFEDDSFPDNPFGQFPFDEPLPRSGRIPHSEQETDSLFSELFHFPHVSPHFEDPFFDQFFDDEFFGDDSTILDLHAYPFINSFGPDLEDLIKKHYELMEKLFNQHQVLPDSIDINRQHWNAPPPGKKSLKELEI